MILIEDEVRGGGGDRPVFGKCLMAFFALCLAARIASAALSPESERLERLRQAVEAKLGRTAEREYLNAFPRTYARFHFVFYGDESPFGKCCGELYDRHEDHLRLLDRLAAKYPGVVLRIQLDVAVGTDGRSDADAVTILQLQLIGWAANRTREFAKALSAYPPKKRLSIIAFLADMEDHSIYFDYQEAVSALSTLGFGSLAQDFMRAREERQKRRHD